MFDVKGKQAFVLDSRVQAWLPRGAVQVDGEREKGSPGSARFSWETSGASWGAGQAPDRSHLRWGLGESSSSARAPLPPMRIGVLAGTDFMNTE